MPVITTITLILALVGLVLVVSGVRRVKRRRIISGGGRGISGALFFALAGVFGALGLNLHTYERLTAEQPVAEVSFERLAPQQYRAVVERPPRTEARVFELHGDEWQLDARILRWTGPAVLMGLDTRYRLERLSGRFHDVDQANHTIPTAHALGSNAGLDLWSLAKRYRGYAPIVDAVYGTAAYTPMADGSRWRASLGRDGLIIRPANQAARMAIAAW